MAAAAPIHEDELLGKAYDSRLMRRLLRYLRPYRALMALAFGLIFATAVLQLAPTLLFQQAIDRVIVPKTPGELPLILTGYLTVLVFSFIARYAQNYVVQIIGQRVMYDIRLAIFSHLQGQSLAYFDRNPVGKMMSRLTNDVDALNELLSSGVVDIAADLLTLVGIAVAMLLLDWRLGLLALITLPVLYWISQQFQTWMRRTYREQRIRLAKVNAFLQENLSGMLILQLFNREARQATAFDKLNRDVLDANIEATRAFALFFPIVNFAAAISLALLIWFGANSILAATITFGVLYAIIRFTDQAFEPIRDLAEKYNIMQAAMAAAERIFMLLDEPVAIHDPDAPLALTDVRGDIEFRHVDFAYNPGEPILRDVSFHIPAGTSVALVGATGAGKTSIISLLGRFYDVQGGAILIDGVDVRRVRQADLRRHIGVVLQDPVLFSGTLAANIRLLDARISDDQIRHAAEFVNAAGFIDRLPDGYEHEVKERGSNLSVGQRQLLAFARAIAFNPEVMLVMDEATSSVDTETEALIQDALEKLMRGRTSIIIAHRLSTIRHVDRIIVLHKGRVVEEGTHDALMAKGDFYYRLYQLQYQDQETPTALGGDTQRRLQGQPR
ncbi:MAG: ABC transporter ATP-binding protein/permease [Chloroflexota bacterium]|nr:ABC transporter ATP-binding protein/permease [Chloroflexota bacterium]